MPNDTVPTTHPLVARRRARRLLVTALATIGAGVLVAQPVLAERADRSGAEAKWSDIELK